MLPLSAGRLTYFREISCLSHEKGGSSDYRLFAHLDSSFARTKWRRNLPPDVPGYQRVELRMHVRLQYGAPPAINKCRVTARFRFSCGARNWKTLVLHNGRLSLGVPLGLRQFFFQSASRERRHRSIAVFSHSRRLERISINCCLLPLFASFFPYYDAFFALFFLMSSLTSQIEKGNAKDICGVVIESPSLLGYLVIFSKLS